MGKLRRSLGIFSLVFYGTGMILGAGIYSVVGPAAGMAREGLWLSFLVSAVVALFTAFSYAELATMYSDAGAEYAYLRHAFPNQRWVSFVSGLVIATVNAATAATVALSFAGYLDRILQSPVLVVALLVLLLVSIINVLGIQASSRTNIILTIVEIFGLLIVIYFGLNKVDLVNKLTSVPVTGVFSGAALVFFSFLGFENIANLAEEAKRPERDLPLAIFASLAIATVLYVLIGISVVALMPPETLANSEAPLAAAVFASSANASWALGVIALFSTANTALIAALSGSRVLFSMARGKDLPKLIAKFSRNGTPWLASLLIFIISSGLLFLGDLKAIASLTSFCSLLACVVVHVAVIVLRYKIPEGKRPFRIPIAWGRLPLMPCVGIALTLSLLTQFDLSAYLSGIAVIGASFLIYGIRKGVVKSPKKRMRRPVTI